jgi:hypothetical protein
VLAFTLVLSNGSVTTVTASSNPDLFTVLKGGGNNFGVVTSYLVRAHPMPSLIWGGNLIFNATASTDAALLSAVRNFTSNYPDPKAGIILTAERAAAGLLDTWIMFLFYDGPEPPTGVFDAFLDAATPFLNTCKAQTYNELVTGNNWAVVKGSVYTIGTESVPLPAHSAAIDPADDGGVQVLETMHAHWRNISGSVLLTVPGLIANIAYQPFPGSAATLAQQMGGGDLYDMDGDVDRIFPELNYAFLDETDFPAVDEAMQETYGGIQDAVQAGIASGALPDAYLPLFANDAYFRQDFWGRMKPDRRALAKQVAMEVDPVGLWRDRTGGFKP